MADKNVINTWELLRIVTESLFKEVFTLSDNVLLY